MQSYSHLSEDERDQIGILRAAGQSMGAIARALCRAKTTISRELRRNALPSGIRRFTPPETIDKLKFASAQVSAHVGDTIEWMKQRLRCAYRDGAKQRLGCRHPSEGDRKGRSPTRGRHRLFLPISSEYDRPDFGGAGMK